jgi:hypothetical protein
VLAGRQAQRVLGGERLEQFLGALARPQAEAVSAERVEEDLRLGRADQLRQLDQRTPGDLDERVGVRRPGDPRDVEERLVDVPQD